MILLTQINSFSLLDNIKNQILMPIKKEYKKSKPVCKVTFSIVAKQAKMATVVGDFNNWNANEGVLVKLKNGTFKAAFELPKETNYQFKYLIDGAYVNEPEADSYVWNDFAGSENSVLSL
jgi:1,4-alpha-glucan branching enzyme